MFIELHDYASGTRVLLNTNKIVFVDPNDNGTCTLVTQEETWEVKESYEQVRSLLDVASLR